jgi:hypothetical protein
MMLTLPASDLLLILVVYSTRRSQQGDRNVRTLFNRCGDREVLLALMALVGAIVVALNS